LPREASAEVVVVGAGIAGLAAAWALRDRDVLVLEAGERVGGRIRSERRGRYWLNFGAHVFGREDSATGRLLRETGTEAVDVPGVLTGVALGDRVVAGRVETFPFRLPLAPADRLALVRAGIRLRLAVARYGRIADTGDQRRVLDFLADRGFADWLGPLPADVDAIIRPTIQRSSGEPEELAAGYGIGYFHLVWDRSGGLARNILGGPSTLPETIAAALGDRVSTGCRVEEVAATGDGVRVRYARAGEANEVSARFVVVATPAYVTRTIVAGLPGDTRRALGEIVYGPYVVGAFLTGETSPMPWDGIYAVAAARRSFNMLFNTANVLRREDGPREPGGTLMAYSGACLGRRLWEVDDERVVTTYLDDLYAIFPEARGTVEEAVVHRWPHGLPYVRPGRNRVQPALERSLGNVFLAGDYLGTLYTDTAIATATAAAEAISARLPPTP